MERRMRGNSHVRCELGEKPVLTGNAEDRVYLSVLHATWLILNGVPLKVVSERLGHSNISTTSDIYGHVLPSADQAAAESLNKVYSPNNIGQTIC
jgi:hypothetical protein